MMKTITLRTLVRDPRKVKGLTRAGNSVQVTDNGQPLWVIQAAVTKDDQKRRRRELEEELAHVLLIEPSKIPLSEIILSSRR
jgi:hypothetical protein